MEIENIFSDEGVFIIAEVSQNHDGSLGQAHACVEAIATTGADAVKFQTHIAAEESTNQEPFRVNFSYEDASRYDYWKRMEWTPDQWRELKTHAESLGLVFLSSPFSITALEMLDEIGVPAWKFGSGEVFNDLLIERAIATHKPLIISTGLCTDEELTVFYEKITSAGSKLVLMECTTAYPSVPSEIPIGRITTLRERYFCPIGLSDHSGTIYPSLAAITLGASVIEVHVTLSPFMFGPDVKASVTIEDLKRLSEGRDYIKLMRTVSTEKESLTERQRELRGMFAKSVYVKEDLKAGSILSDTNLALKKPFQADGVPVGMYRMLIGNKLTRDMKKDELLREGDSIS